jgi:hypothetical protein
MAYRSHRTPDLDQDNRSLFAGIAVAGALLLVLVGGVILIVRSLPT